MDLADTDEKIKISSLWKSTYCTLLHYFILYLKKKNNITWKLFCTYQINNFYYIQQTSFPRTAQMSQILKQRHNATVEWPLCRINT